MLSHLASLVEQDAWEHTWEDEDDDEPQPPAPAPLFQVEAGASLPTSGVRQLVVGLYGAGSVFVSCAFAERLQSTGSVLARVVLPPAKEGGKSEDVAVVHQVDDATLLVLGLKVVPADRAFAFTQLLYQHLPACEETLILHSLGRHEYHVSSSDAYSTSTFRMLETHASRRLRESSTAQPPISNVGLKLLPTTGWKEGSGLSREGSGGATKRTLLEFLEVPNMVDGVAAAILSHLERRGLVGRLVVSVLGEEPGGRLGLEAVQNFDRVLAGLLALTDAQRTQAAKAYPAAVKAFNERLSLPKTSIFL